MHVSSIAPDIDGESGTVQVRVELDNTNRSLVVGERCTLQLALAPNPKQRMIARHHNADTGTTKR